MGSTPTRPERIGSSTVEPVQREGRWFDSSRRPQKRRSSVGRASPRVHCNNELIMTIKKAIEKAIKGGYRGKILDYFLNHNNEVIDTTNCDVLGTLLIDPLFWRCLGTAMGWKKWECDCGEQYEMQGIIICPLCNEQGARESWRQRWHRLIDHLAEGKSVESFFANL